MTSIFRASPNDKIYPVAKIAMAVNSLMAEGVSPAQALKGVDLSGDQLHSPDTRVSLIQVIQCYRNASHLSADRYFAYHTGLRFHVSGYGMYGFAILSSTSFRQAVQFGQRYHQLETPVASLAYSEDVDHAQWKIIPVPLPEIDQALYEFIVELYVGTAVSLHRDIMGVSFAPRQLRLAYHSPKNRRGADSVFGCQVLFAQVENAFVFDRKWMDGSPQLGNELTYQELIRLCDQQLKKMQLRIGLAGDVREALLRNLARPLPLDAVSKQLGVPVRTLKRRLQLQGTSYRKIVDELRTEIAIDYLRETDLSIEDIAHSIGFTEVSNFRHAFRRWTKKTPNEFREQTKSG